MTIMITMMMVIYFHRNILFMIFMIAKKKCDLFWLWLIKWKKKFKIKTEILINFFFLHKRYTIFDTYFHQTKKKTEIELLNKNSGGIVSGISGKQNNTKKTHRIIPLTIVVVVVVVVKNFKHVHDFFFLSKVQESTKRIFSQGF